MAEWSEKEVEALKKYYCDGFTVKEICEFTGRTGGSIRNKAYRLEITNDNRYTEYEKNYVIENYKSYNLKEIAEHLNRPKANICRIAKILGIERNFRKKENPKTYRDENGVFHPIGWKRETKDEKSVRISKMFKKWHSENEHPRGMLGKTHSEEYCIEISKRVSEYWEKQTKEQAEERYIKMINTKIKNGTTNSNTNRSNPYSRTRSGKRKDLNDVFFRSSWEANVARYYNLNGIKWQFEPKTFIFEKIKKGCISYTPDFYLPELDKWVEVKGWMDDKSKTKLKRFEKYFPEEFSKLEMITQKEYKEISKSKHLIENWE